ncbi:MAG: nicotinamide-nucleotide amidohydrolase family protein [Proteobacteria bacterium]|nr:nicotinamide-nucleotide amidohydrolase family protein [Pseudomonadota bacterium]
MADHEAIKELAQVLVGELSSANKAVATAESCTGGWIAKAITDVSGSSVCFAYGIVSYSNGAKESLLGVQNRTLSDHGAVSEAAVMEMAEGALNLSGADICVSVSGIAGPDGGSEEKPVGTVWFAWAVRNGSRVDIEAICKHFDGDRDLVRELTVVHALQGVRERIES